MGATEPQAQASSVSEGLLDDHELPTPASANDRGSTAWRELVRQFTFFDSRAGKYQRVHYVLRGTVLLAGAAIPILTLATDTRVWVAVLGGIVVVGEGMAQLTQAQEHWVRYRSSAESLRAEALAFTTHTGPYRQSDDPPTRLDRLAERINDISADESARWARTARPDTTGDDET